MIPDLSSGRKVWTPQRVDLFWGKSWLAHHPKLGPTNADLRYFWPIPILQEVGIIPAIIFRRWQSFSKFQRRAQAHELTSLWEGKALREDVELLLSFVQAFCISQSCRFPWDIKWSMMTTHCFFWVAHFGQSKWCSVAQAPFTLEAAAKRQNSSHRCPLPTMGNGNSRRRWRPLKAS